MKVLDDINSIPRIQILEEVEMSSGLHMHILSYMHLHTFITCTHAYIQTYKQTQMLIFFKSFWLWNSSWLV